MAIPLLKSLEKFDKINQDYIAKEFAENYYNDRHRGYGPSMHRKLMDVKENGNWFSHKSNAFNSSFIISNQ